MNDSILKKKPVDPIVRRIKPGENIKYLLLIKTPNSDETYWEVIKGREEVYNYIKNNIDIIDPDESFIAANKVELDLDDMHTIYDFIKWVKEKNDIVDEFDIDDYKLGVDTSKNIGVGLETEGNVFTGIAGSYDEQED